MIRLGPKPTGERGAVLILVALCITAIFVFLALVIDLGATRSDRRGGQIAVDNAVASATRTFAEDEDIVAACETSFDFLAVNLGLPSFTGDDCATILSGVCTDTPQTADRTVERSSGDFVAVFTHPVGDLSSLMDVSTIGSDSPTPTDDEAGPPCERVGMQVLTVGDSYFGGLAGAEDRRSVVSAVGRADAGNKKLQALNLLVLERHDCDALGLSGNNTELVVATPVDDPATTDEDESLLPGIVASDSDARDCSGQGDTVQVGGNGAKILAQGPCPDPPGGNDCGIIDVFAPLVDPGCLAANDDLQYACDEGQGTITPDATQTTERYTRKAVDHRYNCKPATDASAPSYDDEPWWTVLEQDIPSCPGATINSDYVDELKAYATSVAPGTFTVIGGGACNAGTVEYPVGNYYVDCTTFRVNAGATVVFKGGNVVFKNNITIQNSSSLELQECVRTDETQCASTLSWTAGANYDESQSSSRGAWAYAGGRVTVNGSGTFRWNRTAFFVGPAGDIAQSGTIISSAPEGGCAADPDCAGPFDDLALWSEGTTPHTFRGGGANDFEGLYFGGRAHFAMSGGTNVELRSAQFVSNTANFSGGVKFTMSPTSDRSVLFDVPASYSLIR